MVNIQQIFAEFTEKHSLSPDAAQLALIERLSHYEQELNNKAKSNNILKIIPFGRKHEASKTQGMYIWGDVGRGKSMLLNIFSDHVHTKRKQRMHFHAFMLQVHKNLAELRKKHTEDPLLAYAKNLSAQYDVLILDELQVNNIADAMIVGRLFPLLIEMGMYVFFASNRIPDDLFKDGLQRERFEPFIDTIKQHLEVFNLENFTDYRLRDLTISNTYLHPITNANQALINKVIAELTDSKPLAPRIITTETGSQWPAFNTYGYTAVFTFKELCEIPLGAIDYIALCKQFSLIIVTKIPQLSQDEHNELLRFITLIDCLYDNHTKLICLADCAIEEIYIKGQHFFEFARTISRLKEMHTHKYFYSDVTKAVL